MKSGCQSLDMRINTLSQIMATSTHLEGNAWWLLLWQNWVIFTFHWVEIAKKYVNTFIDLLQTHSWKRWKERLKLITLIETKLTITSAISDGQLAQKTAATKQATARTLVKLIQSYAYRSSTVSIRRSKLSVGVALSFAEVLFRSIEKVKSIENGWTNRMKICV